MGDEPNAEAKEGFFACCRRNKELAPHLNPYANLLPYFPGIEERAGATNWPDYVDEFATAGGAEIYGYDCYAQMNPGDSGWHPYYENLRLYREAALRNGVPFWNTALSTGHYRYRCPNYDELRWQLNTSIACGAHGISWFVYYMCRPYVNYRLAPIDEHWHRTQTYDDLRRIHRTLHRQYGDLFLRLACVRVQFLPEPYGGGELFEPTDLVAGLESDQPGHPLLLTEFTDVDDGRYVMLVNNSVTDSVEGIVSFAATVDRVFTWDCNGQETAGPALCRSQETRNERGMTIGHGLAPGQEAVYRVEVS